jgi:hypothetical protein
MPLFDCLRKWYEEKSDSRKPRCPHQGGAGRFAVSSANFDVKPEPFGLTTLSDMNAVRKTKREIWRTALALQQSGCRDVLIVGTAEYVRFIVTIKLPKPR